MRFDSLMRELGGLLLSFLLSFRIAGGALVPVPGGLNREPSRIDQTLSVVRIC